MKRKRNKELTRAELINAAIADIAANGFKGLTSARLAEHVGRHGSRITGLFGGLNGLIKAAVAERDHWASLFSRYSIPPRAKGWQIREMFSGMMCRNLVAFKENPDMQKMIHGQISLDHEVLREISELREREGAKLLVQTDPHFEGSGVCFRSIIALLLYGSYGLVLHSACIGGTVAGVDINREEDMLEVKTTLRYVIELAWKDAGQKRKRAKRIRKS